MSISSLILILFFQSIYYRHHPINKLPGNKRDSLIESTVPSEVIYKIISFIRKDFNDLKRLSSVNKNFNGLVSRFVKESIKGVDIWNYYKPSIVINSKIKSRYFIKGLKDNFIGNEVLYRAININYRLIFEPNKSNMYLTYVSKEAPSPVIFNKGNYMLKVAPDQKTLGIIDLNHQEMVKTLMTHYKIKHINISKNDSYILVEYKNQYIELYDNNLNLLWGVLGGKPIFSDNIDCVALIRDNRIFVYDFTAQLNKEEIGVIDVDGQYLIKEILSFNGMFISFEINYSNSNYKIAYSINLGGGKFSELKFCLEVFGDYKNLKLIEQQTLDRFKVKTFSGETLFEDHGKVICSNKNRDIIIIDKNRFTEILDLNNMKSVTMSLDDFFYNDFMFIHNNIFKFDNRSDYVAGVYTRLIGVSYVTILSIYEVKTGNLIYTDSFLCLDIVTDLIISEDGKSLYVVFKNHDIRMYTVNKDIMKKTVEKSPMWLLNFMKFKSGKPKEIVPVIV